MSKIHVTHQNYWELIQKAGSLKPKGDVFPHATGGDTDRVSVFNGVDTCDSELLRALRHAVAYMKNWKDDEMVVLEVLDESSFDWADYPEQAREMVLYGNLQEDMLDRFQGYSKTRTQIPLESIIDITSLLDDSP